MRTAYRCRAYPDPAQQQVLARTFGCIRVVWNRILAARRARYAADGTSTSYPRHLERKARSLARHLARAITDCGWGEFRRQLAYKCQRYGRELIVIDRWFPSSKTCSACGHRLAQLSLGTRHWTCPCCGARHDRDVNATANILAAGRAVARGVPGDACGAGVRHSGSSRVRPAVKQEPQPVTAGILVP